MNRLHSVNQFLKAYEKLKYEDLIVDDAFFKNLIALYPKEEGKKMFLEKQRLLKGFQEFYRPRISEYQEPRINPILQDINCKIQQVLSQHDISLERNVYITSLTRKEIKFAKIKIGNEEDIICVYSTTIEYLYFLAVAMGSFFEEDKHNKESIKCNWQDLYNSNRMGCKMLIDIINRIKIKKWAINLQWLNLPYSKAYAYLLYNPAEFFGIAHEYAHIIYKHPKSNEVAKEQNIFHELQADKLAFEITMQHFCNEGTGSIAYIGIEFLFLSLELYQNILNALTSNNYISLRSRRLLLRGYLEKEFPDTADSVLRLCDSNIELLKKVYKDNFEHPPTT